jgi:hypothetical protein
VRLTRGTLFAGTAAAAAILAITGGLLAIGSPAEARLERLDQRRVQDLTRVSAAVDLYWTRQGRLPGSLRELPPTTAAAVDPATGEAYAYRVIDDATYEVCATFVRASAEPRSGQRFWTHDAARQCFALRPEKVGR